MSVCLSQTCHHVRLSVTDLQSGAVVSGAPPDLPGPAEEAQHELPAEEGPQEEDH